MLSEARFRTYGLLKDDVDASNVELELQGKTLRVWKETACLAGKFQVSYESF
jgi:hypothetical protein